MEEIFCMEWNMEEIFRYGMEKNCRYGIWKNRLPFHYMPCPTEEEFFSKTGTITSAIQLFVQLEISIA